MAGNKATSWKLEDGPSTTSGSVTLYHNGRLAKLDNNIATSSNTTAVKRTTILNDNSKHKSKGKSRFVDHIRGQIAHIASQQIVYKKVLHANAHSKPINPVVTAAAASKPATSPEIDNHRDDYDWEVNAGTGSPIGNVSADNSFLFDGIGDPSATQQQAASHRQRKRQPLPSYMIPTRSVINATSYLDRVRPSVTSPKSRPPSRMGGSKPPSGQLGLRKTKSQQQSQASLPLYRRARIAGAMKEMVKADLPTEVPRITISGALDGPQDLSGWSQLESVAASQSLNNRTGISTHYSYSSSAPVYQLVNPANELDSNLRDFPFATAAVVEPSLGSSSGKLLINLPLPPADLDDLIQDDLLDDESISTKGSLSIH